MASASSSNCSGVFNIGVLGMPTSLDHIAKICFSPGMIRHPRNAGMLIFPYRRTLISLNLDSARSNLLLKSHIALRIARKVADFFALSACPNVKMLLFRRYPMILGSVIL